MIKGRAFIYLIVTLLIGFALGMFSGGLHQVRKGDEFRGMRPEFRLGDMLARELQLTEAQLEEVEDIFADFEEEAEQRRKEIRNQVDENLDSLREELLPYLTKEQVRKLDDWMEHKPGPGMMPPPPGPGPRMHDGGPGPHEPGPPPPDRQNLPPAENPPPPGQDTL